MGPLREMRVRMQLEVRVWGMNSSGKPFSQTARTVEISGNGARLEGIAGLQQPGEIIGVQHAGQKARFQVLWIGEKGTPQAGQIGLACLEPGKCIWQQALQDSRDEFEQVAEVLSRYTAAGPPVAVGSASGGERRRYPRHKCSGQVSLTKGDADASISAKLTDIGLGGFYAETFSALPQEAAVEFVIQADALEIRGRGIVRTAHPSVGNGVAFTEMAAEDWQRLHRLIERVASPTSCETSVPAVDSLQTDIAPALKALLQLLERKGLISRDEFLKELVKIKPEAES
jgi:hypothetical protein